MNKKHFLFLIVCLLPIKLFSAANEPLQLKDFPIVIKVVKHKQMSRCDKIMNTISQPQDITPELFDTLWSSETYGKKFGWQDGTNDELFLNIPLNFSCNVGYNFIGYKVVKQINTCTFKLLKNFGSLAFETSLTIETHSFYDPTHHSIEARHSPTLPLDICNRFYIDAPITSIIFVLNKNDEFCVCFYDNKKVGLLPFTRGEKYKFGGVLQ